MSPVKHKSQSPTSSRPKMKFILFVSGAASRMWPFSTNQNPKAFAKPNPLGGDDSVFQQMVGYLRQGGFSVEDIFVATSEQHSHYVREQAPDIPDDQIIVEPAVRDNAAAVGLATTIVDHRFPGTTIALIWASDHYLMRPDTFAAALRQAEQIVDQQNLIVQINVRPSAAHTHVGYVEIGDQILEDFGGQTYAFKQHVEKPDLKTARRYFREGTWLIHTGYRVCRADTLLKLYKDHAPDMYEDLMQIRASLGTPNEQQVINEVYPRMRKDSIDFAIHEHTKPDGQAVIAADLGWKDPGDFGTLYLEMAKDEVGVAIAGKCDAVVLDTTNSLIMAPEGVMVAAIGLDNIAIVVSGNSILVMDKSRAAHVKQVVAEIRDQGREDYL